MRFPVARRLSTLASFYCYCEQEGLMLVPTAHWPRTPEVVHHIVLKLERDFGCHLRSRLDAIQAERVPAELTGQEEPVLVI